MGATKSNPPSTRTSLEDAMRRSMDGKAKKKAGVHRQKRTNGIPVSPFQESNACAPARKYRAVLEKYFPILHLDKGEWQCLPLIPLLEERRLHAERQVEILRIIKIFIRIDADTDLEGERWPVGPRKTKPNAWAQIRKGLSRYSWGNEHKKKPTRSFTGYSLHILPRLLSGAGWLVGLYGSSSPLPDDLDPLHQSIFHQQAIPQKMGRNTIVAAWQLKRCHDTGQPENSLTQGIAG